MNILLFGASSGIGIRLIEMLHKEKNGAKKYNITAVCRPGSPNNAAVETLVKESGKVIYIDACGKNPRLDILDDIPRQDYCYLLAWDGTKRELRNNRKVNKTSRIGLIKCLTFLLDKGKISSAVIFTGSQAEYGNTESYEVTEETVCNPQIAYGLEKLIFGKEAYQLCVSYGIKFYEMRLHSIYGGHVNPRGIICELISSLKANKTFRFNTSCDHVTDYVYVDDCINALLQPLFSEFPDGCYNISSNQSQSMRHYIEIIRRIANPSAEILFGNSHDKNFNFAFNSDKFRGATGWKSETIFEQGITEFIKQKDSYYDDK